MSDEYDRTGWSTVMAQKNAEIERLRAAGQAMHDVLDSMWKCGLRQDGVAAALDLWDGTFVAATPKEDDR
jgi:hypothetical protein